MSFEWAKPKKQSLELDVEAFLDLKGDLKKYHAELTAFYKLIQPVIPELQHYKGYAERIKALKKLSEQLHIEDLMDIMVMKGVGFTHLNVHTEASKYPKAEIRLELPHVYASALHNWYVNAVGSGWTKNGD